MIAKKKSTIKSEKVKMYNPVTDTYFFFKRKSNPTERRRGTIIGSWSPRSKK